MSLRLLPIALIRIYQKAISPLLGAHCRFTPSCSEYAAMAIDDWGFAKGTWLAVKRILSCHPWNEGGLDLPPRNEARPRG